MLQRQKILKKHSLNFGLNKNKKRILENPFLNLLAVAKDSHELNRLLLEWFRAYAFMLIHKNDANIQH